MRRLAVLVGLVGVLVAFVPSASAEHAVSAICNDGTESRSHNRQGTCSSHGGVAQFVGPLADSPSSPTTPPVATTRPPAPAVTTTRPATVTPTTRPATTATTRPATAGFASTGPTENLVAVAAVLLVLGGCAWRVGTKLR